MYRNEEIKIRLKDGAKFSQQKGRRIPVHLQEAVNKEIKRLLAKGHIDKVNEIKDDVFIQPTVSTVRKIDRLKMPCRPCDESRNS